jgi:hypothetical protein
MCTTTCVFFSRSTNDYVTRPCKMWDVEADEHETFDGS